ncbi:hypothetical protein IEO21_07390 [Rhodonia placenta]|uniref:Transmembrane protein n=1 Tax=Rhodonia placenta TaxID=104341 RepID=A0A8H7NY94_9APHY|nr:hypothetical protein IEO21_07390 [Postia placenta]
MSQQHSVTPHEFVEIKQENLDGYTFLAFMTVYIYEFLITFDQLARVWHQPLSTASILLLLLHVGGFACVVLYFGTWQGWSSSCMRVYILNQSWPAVALFIQILANGMIAFANLLEVNGYKWQLPAFIMALLSVSTCWNIYQTSEWKEHGKPSGPADGCYYLSAPMRVVNRVNISSVVCTIVAEALALAVIWVSLMLQLMNMALTITQVCETGFTTSEMMLLNLHNARAPATDHTSFSLSNVLLIPQKLVNIYSHQQSEFNNSNLLTEDLEDAENDDTWVETDTEDGEIV